MEWIHYALLIVSALSVLVTVIDKLVAGKKRSRIPEQTLFLLAVLGGSAAMYLTMLLIRHKTKHKRFMLGLPLILIVQLALWYLL
jgi:uncharacterized membrane protein YsdA (DUF1294 family)